MSKPLCAAKAGAIARTRILAVVVLLGLPRAIQVESSFTLPGTVAAGWVIANESTGAQLKPSGANPAVRSDEAPREKPWRILQEVVKDPNAERRARAVRALGLLAGNVEAEKLAVAALKDEKPNVRAAAATALGATNAENAKGNLEEALGDAEPSVVLAAANSLLLLHDDVGYDTYYEVLTGEKGVSKGLIREQLDTLKDKKKMAQMGFEEGIGFLPFGGIGYEIFKTVTKNDSAPIRAAAAKKLAHDPEPDAANALDAVALREEASLVSKIASAMDDKNDVVRFTAAACVVHLSGLPEKANGSSGSRP